MKCLAYTDGASRGNPGDAGIGVIVRDEQGKTLFSTHGYIGKATNNVAEYTALLVLLRSVQTLECRHLVVHSDSELMVRQINGAYKVKDLVLKQYHQRVRQLLAGASFTFELRHVPREMNAEADGLANSGIDARQPIEV